MKGKTLVIGIIVFVLLVVGGIYLAMMSTINEIKEENDLAKASVIMIAEEQPDPILKIS